MPQQSLWAAPSVPTTLTINVHYVPDIGTGAYRVEVITRARKGSKVATETVQWPEGANGLMAQALGEVVDRFVWSERLAEPIERLRVVLNRARGTLLAEA